MIHFSSTKLIENFLVFSPTIMKNDICDDPNEIEIHKKKFADYVKFFTRNYLYRMDGMVWKKYRTKFSFISFFPFVFISLQIGTIKKISVDESDRGKVIQTLLSIYNLICISFNSYLKNLRHHRLNSEPDKLRSFLERIEAAMMISFERQLVSEEELIRFSGKIHDVYGRLCHLEMIRDMHVSNNSANSIPRKTKDPYVMYRSDAERKRRPRSKPFELNRVWLFHFFSLSMISCKMRFELKVS